MSTQVDCAETVRLRIRIFAPLSVLALLLLASCVANKTRVLQAISISPTNAAAHDYPGGLVQFTATGTFSAEPMTVSPLAVVWAVGHSPWILIADFGLNGVVIDSNGLASCKSGWVGTEKIFATATANPELLPSAANAVVATAEMTCP